MECIFFIVIGVTLTLVTGNPIVRVQDGLLRGTWKVSTYGRTFASFQGVPYASPPICDNRFKDPQPMTPWDGEWDATQFLSSCLQYDPFSDQIRGMEDCLYLNVYSPRLEANASLPVVIFIHGGAFMYGGGNLYYPDHLMDKDIVLVIMNYRLGPLGFLSTGDELLSGNYGLKDQSYALQWVKRNIKMFGGDPANVTLTGNSAGGASVHYHYLSTWSHGTFHRGVAFSGSAFAPWTFATKPAEKAKRLAAIVGCPTSSGCEMISCLKQRPGEVIVNAQYKMFDWKVRMFTPFTPTVEAPGVGNPFLSEYPFRASKRGVMAKLPLIASVTSEEGLYPAATYQADPTILPELEIFWNKLASNIFEYNDTLPREFQVSVAQKIKQHYIGDKPVGQETFRELVQALGDRHFVVDVGKMSQIHAEESGQPVYVYKYSFRGEKSLSNLMAHDTKNYGTSHADDLMHILKSGSLDSVAPDDVAMKMVMIEMLYSFATSGIPKLPNGTVWSPVTRGSPELDYMEISSPSSFQMKSSSDFGQKLFWNSLGLLENENRKMAINYA